MGDVPGFRYSRRPLPADLLTRASEEVTKAAEIGFRFSNTGDRGLKDRTYPAYLRGRIDRMRGRDSKDCPYPDKRNTRGTVTFSRAYINAWFYGWEDEVKWEEFLKRST